MHAKNSANVYTLVNPQNGHLAFKVFSFEDNSYFDHLQRHNYYSILLVREGAGRLHADFSTYDFNTLTLMCFSPYQPYLIESKGPLKGWSLNFHPDFFCIHKHHEEVACNGVLFNNIYHPPLLGLQNDEYALLESLIRQQMVEELQRAEVAQQELLISYLKIFLINASRIKISRRPAEAKNLTRRKEPFILQHLKDAIEQHYRTRHSPSDYAHLLHITPKALSKITKLHFQKTLTDLIAERIMIEAKRELYLTSKTVKEIAYELGFNDEYYFSRFFKTKADISPQLYRHTVGFAKAEV